MEVAKSVLSSAMDSPRAVHTFYRSVKRTLLGKKLKEKVVLITGASSGIGRALAHELFRHGCKLILASRNKDSLQQLTHELLASAYQQETVFEPAVVSLDMSNDQSIRNAAQEALQMFGFVDICINCAGISHRGTVIDTTINVHREIMQINYFGPLILIRELLESMVSKGSGHIVNISSLQGLMALPSRSAYSASKHALQAFSDSLRMEMNSRCGLRSGVKVTVASPGYVNTNLARNARTGSGQLHGVADATQLSGYDPEYVAREIVNSIALEEDEVVIAKLSHATLPVLRHLFPTTVFRILEIRDAKAIGNLRKYLLSWLPFPVPSALNHKQA